MISPIYEDTNGNRYINIVVYNNTYKIKYHPDKPSKLSYHYFVYGTEVNWKFNKGREFVRKVYDKTSEEMKLEYLDETRSLEIMLGIVETDEMTILREISLQNKEKILTVEKNLSKLQAKVETNIVNVNSKLVSVESKIETNIIDTTNRFGTVETKVKTNTVSIETLRTEYEAKIAQLDLEIIYLKENDKTQMDRIISLESTVNVLQENDRLQQLKIQSLKDYNKIQDQKIVSLQRTVSKHEQEISDRRREIVYINKLRDEESGAREYLKQQKIANREYRRKNRVVGIMTSDGPKTYEELYKTNSDTEWFPKYCMEDDMNELSISIVEAVEKDIEVINNRSLSNQSRIKTNRNNHEMLVARVGVIDKVQSENIERIDKNVNLVYDRTVTNRNDMLLPYPERRSKYRKRN